MTWVDSWGYPYVLVGDGDISDEELALITHWLRLQPLVVVGVTQSPQSSSHEWVDVVVQEAEVETMTRAIMQNPMASLVLVQLLRSIGDLSFADALIAESLAYAVLQAGEEHATWLAANRGTFRARPIDPEDAVLMSRTESTLRLTLNTPQNRNALSAPMRDALSQALQLVLADASIKKVEVDGAGPVFSAGGDLSEFGSVANVALAHQIRGLRMPAKFLIPCRDRFEFWLHGACIGAGIEIPAFAATVCAAPDTTFRLPEIGMGLIPGAGGCVSITHRVGRQRAAYMALLGRTVLVEEALSWGLVDEVRQRA